MKVTNNDLPKKQSMLFRIVTNLTFWVLIAIVSGILLGHYFPAAAVNMKVIGDTFIDIIKIFIAPIIFLTIVLGISGMGDLRKVGRIGLKALIYFEIVTTFALIIGVGVAYIIQPGKIDKTGLDMQDHTQYTEGSRDFSWVQFFFDNVTLQVLLAAIIAGIILTYYSKREQAVSLLYKCSALMYLIKASMFWP